MKYGDHGYSDAKCCGNCIWQIIAVLGSSLGHYCMQHRSRVNKLKICNDFDFGLDENGDVDEETWSAVEATRAALMKEGIIS